MHSAEVLSQSASGTDFTAPTHWESRGGRRKDGAVAVSSGTAPTGAYSVGGSNPTDLEAASRATSDPYSLSREPERRQLLKEGQRQRPGRPAAARGASGSAGLSGAPVQTKTEKAEGGEPSESVELETRRKKESQSKVEDEDYDDEEEDYDDESDDVLPEAQPSHPRNPVDTSARFRQNALHIYGLDFLKTGHMDDIFSQFDHKFVEWINDSSANIIFGDPVNAKKALESLSFPKVGDEPWRRTPDILVSEDVPPIFLQMRLAASTDAKRMKKAMPKVLPRDELPSAKGRGRKGRKGSGRGAGGDGGNALDEVLQGPGTKRPKAPVTSEEREMRQKRAQRFKDWLAAATGSQPGTPLQRGGNQQEAGANAGSTSGKANGSGGRRAREPIFEVTEEELAKRLRRSDRFGVSDSTQAPAAAAPADSGALGAQEIATISSAEGIDSAAAAPAASASKALAEGGAAEASPAAAPGEQPVGSA